MAGPKRSPMLAGNESPPSLVGSERPLLNLLSTSIVPLDALPMSSVIGVGGSGWSGSDPMSASGTLAASLAATDWVRMRDAVAGPRAVAALRRLAALRGVAALQAIIAALRFSTPPLAASVLVASGPLPVPLRPAVERRR